MPLNELQRTFLKRAFGVQDHRALLAHDNRTRSLARLLEILESPRIFVEDYNKVIHSLRPSGNPGSWVEYAFGDIPQAMSRTTNISNAVDWLSSVVRGDYSQSGNSDGASSAVHFEMKRLKDFYEPNIFRAFSLSRYERMIFSYREMGHEVAGELLLSWVKHLFSDPWKITRELPSTHLYATRRANQMSSNPELLRGIPRGIRQILDETKPAGIPDIKERELDTLSEGAAAIAIGLSRPGTVSDTKLHYLYLEKNDGLWDVYNSQSCKLNPNRTREVPETMNFDNAFRTESLNVAGKVQTTEKWIFSGYFIH